MEGVHPLVIASVDAGAAVVPNSLCRLPSHASQIDFVCHDAIPYADASGATASGDIYGHIKSIGKFWETQRTEVSGGCQVPVHCYGAGSALGWHVSGACLQGLPQLGWGPGTLASALYLYVSCGHVM